jgi:DNA-binding MarR family transcriptional regulator
MDSIVKKSGKKGNATDTARSNAPQRLTYGIGNLDRALNRRLTDALAPFGITLAQYTALSVLKSRGPSSNAKVADRSFITPQSANTVTSAMVARGWVAREPDPSHGRVILLCLTKEGAAMLEQCDAEVRAIEARIIEGIRKTDVALFQELLGIFARNLRD